MNIYTQASEIINKNDKAIVIFTHGEHFSFDPTGNGSTGNWVVNPKKFEKIDKVIIYLRRKGEKINQILIGNYTGIEKAAIPKRYVIRFSNLQEVGTSKSNWLQFAKAGQNPISYIPD